VSEGTILDDTYMNFKNFGNAMILLLRVSTGEDWNRIMFDTYPYQQFFSPLYFISFVVICSYVMLNLFVLVIIQQFDQYYLPQDNIISKFKESLEDFKETWKAFSSGYGGMKIKESQLISFFQSLKEPLGMQYRSRIDVQKNIITMGIKSLNGWIFFNELLYRCMRGVYGRMKESPSDSLKTSELKTQLKIYMKSHIYNKKKSGLFRGSEKTLSYAELAQKDKTVNPFLTMFYYTLSFKRWKASSTTVRQRKCSEDEKESEYDYETDQIQTCSEQDSSSSGDNDLVDSSSFQRENSSQLALIKVQRMSTLK